MIILRNCTVQQKFKSVILMIYFLEAKHILLDMYLFVVKPLGIQQPAEPNHLREGGQNRHRLLRPRRRLDLARRHGGCSKS